jgi:predicted lipid-binding transport protein (Tim44 family)
MRRSTLITAIAVAALALAPSFADARAGGGSSSGSRGSRTYSAPPSTNTAPGMAAPMERSMAPRPAPGGAPVGQAPQRPGFGSGLMGGLAGGLLGVGLGGLLMGNGFFGGGLGILGLLGFILQIALVFFVARFLFRLLFRRPQGPAMAGGPGAGASPMSSGVTARTGVPMGGTATGGAPMGGAQPALQVGPGDFQAFERLLKEVQAAWSSRDLRTLSSIATPEMASIFAEQLAEQTSRGVQNVVSDVVLEQGDLSEAWSEGGREYATVAMRFSMVDVTRDASGRVVDGDVALRTMATEVWTFVRVPGGRWLLSAIQQTR